MALKTNYKDDVFSGSRKYHMTNNGDGTVSFEDMTSYTQRGDTYGSAQVNELNTTVNSLQTNSYNNGDSAETSLADNDYFPFYDTSASKQKKTLWSNIKSVLSNTLAVKNHASTGTSFGVGNASNYGHVKLSDNYKTSAGAASASVGASSKAVYDSYTENKNSIGQTNINVGNLNNSVSTLSSTVSALRTTESQHYTELKNADTNNYNTLNGKITTANNNISGLQTDVSSLKTRATNLESRATNLESRATNIESKNVSQDNDIRVLITRCSDLETHDVDQDDAISNLSSRATSLYNRTNTLENELTANGNRIYMDYKNGRYGYNTSANRGADTFFPFNYGVSEDNRLNYGSSGTNIGSLRAWDISLDKGDYIVYTFPNTSEDTLLFAIVFEHMSDFYHSLGSLGSLGMTVTIQNGSYENLDSMCSLVHINDGGGKIRYPSYGSYGSNVCEWTVLILR